MTPEEFIKWLDEEIEKAEKQDIRENRKMEPNFQYMGRVTALEEVKEKFLTLTPPTTSNND